MLWGWRKRHRRKRILTAPVPARWLSLVDSAVPWYRHWDSRTRKKLLDDIRIFIAEKHWEGWNGLGVSERIQVVIAAQAAMMLVGIQGYCFDGVQTVLVYPAAFRYEGRDGPIVSREARVGEAWHRGPIVLSWADVTQRLPGRNVVVHELAHHLDGLDGDMSGNPILASLAAQRRWETVARAGFQQLRSDLSAGLSTLLDPYAATSRAEYFAVACEVFFEMPVELKQRHPDLHACLAELFNVDPARWTR
jgi:Mlc titration factor MtfA (ptsG expression regulator)